MNDKYKSSEVIFKPFYFCNILFGFISMEMKLRVLTHECAISLLMFCRLIRDLIDQWLYFFMMIVIQVIFQCFIELFSHCVARALFFLLLWSEYFYIARVFHWSYCAFTNLFIFIHNLWLLCNREIKQHVSAHVKLTCF